MPSSSYILISAFTTDLRHIQGKNNVVADALSRVQLNENAISSMDSSMDTIDYKAMADVQPMDNETHALCTAIISLQLKRFQSDLFACFYVICL